MEVLIIILLVLIWTPLLFVVVQYNALVGLNNYIRNAWGNIDTELKRRYELIPNLVEVVKGYAAHEKSVFERVTELRNRCQNNQGSPSQQAVDENQLVGALKQLYVVIENYPQLKSDQHFLRLQEELVNTEDRIQAARRFYNGNIRDYRNKCETFPSNLIAQMFRFEAKEFFAVDSSVREVPSLEF